MADCLVQVLDAFARGDLAQAEVLEDYIGKSRAPVGDLVRYSRCQTVSVSVRGLGSLRLTAAVRRTKKLATATSPHQRRFTASPPTRPWPMASRATLDRPCSMPPVPAARASRPCQPRFPNTVPAGAGAGCRSTRSRRRRLQPSERPCFRGSCPWTNHLPPSSKEREVVVLWILLLSVGCSGAACFQTVCFAGHAPQCSTNTMCHVGTPPCRQPTRTRRVGTELHGASVSDSREPD